MQLRQTKDVGQQLDSVYGLKYLWWNFSIIGIHPPAVAKAHPVWHFLYLVYAVVINFVAGFCLPATMLANLMLVKSVQEVIGNLSLSITIAVSMTKELAILYNRRLLLKANDYLEQLDKRCNPHASDRANIFTAVRLCHWFYAVYISFYGFCALGFAYIGWANHQLVYNAWFPTIFVSEQKNYLAAYIFQNLSQTFTVFQNGNNDMYPLCYITLMIYHLRSLADRVQRIGKDTKLSEDENVMELRRCIQDHKNIQA
ncbi:odorant receptor 59a-like [Haematobia irritans]|uniref:odorant receptor 59a-like n=1 Tax=Haematobia irritans TaxID=7368 RepID=UPI003F5000ED